VFASSLSWLFTVVFAFTGLYALVRLAELSSTTDRSGSRIVELSHLLMSVAMIAMSWAWSVGPTSGSGIVQIVVFGFFTIFFLARLTPASTGDERFHVGYHVVMNAAMVFMVAAMPQIMGADMSAHGGSGGSHHGGDDGMAGMAGMPGMGGTGGADGTVSTATPLWATAATWLFVVLLFAAAFLWVVHVARPAAAGHDAAVPASDGGAVAVGTRVPSPTTGFRLDAGCHLLMSVGMAGMLLAML
jgi:hypothetical protein